jgi:hypothetical protein
MRDEKLVIFQNFQAESRSVWNATEKPSRATFFCEDENKVEARSALKTRRTASHR